MAKFKKRLEFANYTLLFGDKKKLLDEFHSIVLPSFSTDLVRTKKDVGTFFFIDVALKEINGELAIIGKLVKSTALQRDQVYDSANKILVPNKKILKSAPSAIFALLLSNHRLIYCREMVGSPSIDEFYSTSSQFLNKVHMEVVNKEIYNKLPVKIKNKFKEKKKISLTRLTSSLESSNRYTKIIAETTDEILKIHPFPNLRITPLTEDQAIDKYLKQFEKLVDCVIRLTQKNNEIDNDDFWEAVSKKGEEAGSDKSEVKFHNKSGLKRDTIATEIMQATANGNSEIRLDGFDKSNAQLTGSNDDFKLTRPVEQLSTNVSEAAITMIQAFKDLITESQIKLATSTENVTTKIDEIKRRLNE